jgi:hypothetical protein
MSSKTRTRNTRTTASTTGSARRLQSVPEQTVAAKVRTDTEDKLWEALHATPNSTAADLSFAAKIGKSTAQKILVKWANDGSVTRTVTRVGFGEGGRRAADLWAITEVDSSEVDPAPVGIPSAEDADPTDTAQAEPDAPAAVVGVPDVPDTDGTVVEGDSTESTDVEAIGTEKTDAATDDVQDPVDAVAIQSAAAEPVVAEVSEPADDGAATDVGTTTKAGADAAGEKKARLASGSLRGMVEDYLRDHPGEEFGPTAIANALGGKSSGAVSNALDKLADDGTAVKTKDKPRRFGLASAEQTAAPAPTN